jgi:hypothetical protein
VGGPVVGNGGFGEVVPPLAGGLWGVGAEEGVRVREEGGVDEGFLLSRISVHVCFPSMSREGDSSAYLVVRPRSLPLPQRLHLVYRDAVER